MGVVLFLFTIGIPESYAQQLKISGIVKDAETNNPLLGASVVIRGRGPELQQTCRENFQS